MRPLLAALALSVGCTQPVLRSMRLEKGLTLTGAAEVMIGGEDALTHSTSDDGDDGSEGATLFWPFNADVRWGFVDDDGFGVATGMYFPGMGNQKINGSGGECLPPLWMFVPYVQLGANLGRLALSVGGEAGCGAGALFGGFDIQLYRHEMWAVALAPVARLTVPWRGDGQGAADQTPRGDSVEMGVALRVGGLFIQYWHERSEGPIRRIEHPAGSQEAQTWHTISLGAEVQFQKIWDADQRR